MLVTAGSVEVVMEEDTRSEELLEGEGILEDTNSDGVPEEGVSEDTLGEELPGEEMPEGTLSEELLGEEVPEDTLSNELLLDGEGIVEGVVVPELEVELPVDEERVQVAVIFGLAPTASFKK